MVDKTQEELEQELEEAARLAREALDKANAALERLRNAGHEPPEPSPAPGPAQPDDN